MKSRRVARALRIGAVAGLVAAQGLLPLHPASGSAELIINGGFESPNIASPAFAIFSSIPGWTHAPRPGTTSSGIEIQDHVAGTPDPTGGDQFVELDSNGPSIVSQDIPTTAGLLYRLSFLYSARPGTMSVQNHFEASAGPASTVVGPLTSASSTVWVSRTLDFVATSSTSTVRFTDLGPEESGGGLGAYIDNVSVMQINRDPDCSGVSAEPSSLWPANHKLVSVHLSGATDPDGDATALTITGVTQDEPVDGAADGSTSPDAVLGTSDDVQVRAERSAIGDGRVYRVSFSVSDGLGGTCTGTADVAVPHSNDGVPAVDSGQNYSSL